MTHEAAGGDAGRELPQAKSLVPGGGKCVGTVRGDYLRSVRRGLRLNWAASVRSRRRCGSDRVSYVLDSRKRRLRRE